MKVVIIPEEANFQAGEEVTIAGILGKIVPGVINPKGNRVLKVTELPKDLAEFEEIRVGLNKVIEDKNHQISRLYKELKAEAKIGIDTLDRIFEGCLAKPRQKIFSERYLDSKVEENKALKEKLNAEGLENAKLRTILDRRDEEYTQLHNLKNELEEENERLKKTFQFEPKPIKKIVKKEVQGWVNLYRLKDGSCMTGTYVYKTEVDAKRHTSYEKEDDTTIKFIGTSTVTITEEVEEVVEPIVIERWVNTYPRNDHRDWWAAFDSDVRAREDIKGHEEGCITIKLTGHYYPEVK